MKQKSQKLRDEQDRLNDKWTEVLSAEQELEDRFAGHNKYYPRRKLLPGFDEEVDGSLLSKREWAENPDRPPRGRDKPAGGYPNPPEIPRRYGKDSLPPLKPYDLRKKLASRPATPSRSIYGSKERPPAGQAGYLAWLAKNGDKRDYTRDRTVTTSDVRHITARVRGAAHPMCFTDEVMQHQFPKGFKPINIEQYNGTTDPTVWIEDFLMHIHMA